MSKLDQYKHIIRLLISLVIMFLIIKFFKYIQSSPQIAQDVKNIRAQEAFDSQYNFVVTQLYRDSTNHNNATIKGTGADGKEQEIVGTMEFLALYSTVQVGDTLVKYRKSYQFFIKNNVFSD